MKYILFDLDGTLVNSSLGITRCFEYAFLKMGLTPPSAKELFSCIGPPLLQSFLKFFGGDRERALQGVALYRERYKKEGWKECSLYAGVEECLKTFYEQGKVLALATSKPEIFAKKILSRFEIDKYFTVTVGSKLDNSFDDKSQIIQKAITLLGAERENSAMVGDREQDIVGAKANGVLPVGIGVGFAREGELELAGAGYIARDFTELLKILGNL